MHIRSTLRLSLLAIALIGFVSCRCDDTFQCPAFDATAAPYTLPAAGDSLVFRNSNGARLVFGATTPFISPTYQASTKQNLFGGCDVEACDARASSEATSATSRNGSNILSLQHMMSSDARSGVRNDVYSSGAVFDYRFAMDDLTLIENNGDTTLYAFPLGPRTYDTLLVRRRDTLGTRVDSLAIWRVYIHRPEGVVGFEDRQTGSLFYRQ